MGKPILKSTISKAFSSITYSVNSAIIVLLILVYGCTNNDQLKQTGMLDFSQADLMLEFLTELHQGKQDSVALEPILNAEGTKLIVKQMNIVRSVALDQYGQLLKGLSDNRLPQIEPVDSTERAKRGVHGLTNDIWMVLNWAEDHTDTLKQELALLKKADVYTKAENLANQYLPEPLDVEPRLYLVMGGRAGAAALDGNNIYIDVLLMTFQSVRKNIPLMNETEAVEYFAHEMHHIGLARYHEKKYKSLTLNENQRRLFSMLKSIVAEGAANYLISNHRNTDEMRKYFNLSNNPDKQEKLLNSFEELITELSKGKFKNQDEYEKSNTLMLGLGYHMIGSVMLNIIDQAGGLESINKVIADPAQLLIEYNKAAKMLNADNNDLYIFNDTITGIVGKLSI